MDRDTAVDAFSANSVASMDRKLRKRMTMLQAQRSRVFRPQFPQVVKETPARATMRGVSNNCNNAMEESLEEDDSLLDNVSDFSGRVSDMRRRRVFQTHHRRPFPINHSATKPKKKIKFWDESSHKLPPPSSPARPQSPAEIARQRFEQYSLSKTLHQEPPSSVSLPLVWRSSSFSSYNNLTQESSIESMSMRGSFDYMDWLHPGAGGGKAESANIALPRVLWYGGDGGTDTRNPRVLVQNDYDDPSHNPREDLSKDEIMDGMVYEEDEIMTPVKLGKATFMDQDELLRQCPTVTPSSMGGTLLPASLFSTPQKDAKLADIGFIVDGTTPPAKGRSCNNSSAIASRTIHQVTPTTTTPPNAPRKEPHYSKFHSDLEAEEEASGGAYVPHTPMTIDCTPLTSPVPSPQMQMYNFPRIRSSSMDELDCRELHNPNVSSTGSILWQSLFQDEKGFFCVMNVCEAEKVAASYEVNSTLEALIEGVALRKDDGKNTLKLFIDMYQKETFDHIVHSLKELTSVKTLVVCRGLDVSSPTHRSPSELKDLLDGIRGIENLESLMLLNFGSEALMDLAMTLNQHPSIYRLQIHMAEGTLNGELLGVMATAPKLTHVQIEVNESCAIGTLTNSKTLQSLRLTSDSIRFERSHVRTLVYGLKYNQALTSLDLAPTISVEDFRSLCHALKENERLESLRVSLKLYTEEECNIVAVELASLFKTNATLINVWNYSYESCHLNEHSKYVVLSSLKRSHSMRQFKFFSEDPADTSTGAEEHLERRIRHDEKDELMEVASRDNSYLPDDDCYHDNFCDPSQFDCLQDISDTFRRLTGSGSKSAF